VTTSTLLPLTLNHAAQIAVLAIAVTISVRLFFRERPHVAYTLWLLVLLKCVTPPLWGHTLAIFGQFDLVPATSASHTKLAEADHQLAANDVNLLTETLSSNGDVSVWVPLPSASQPQMTADLEQQPTRFEKTTTPPSELTAAGNDAEQGWYLIIAGIMVSGSLMSAAVLFARCRLCLSAIRRCRKPNLEPALQKHVHTLARQLGVRRVPRLIVSGMRFGPAVLGFIRPVIVIPECLLQANDRLSDDDAQHANRSSSVRSSEHAQSPKSLTPPQWLNLILAHELMHIRRGDLRAGVLQAVAHCLWWFHPLVWLVNRRLSREAERCCDEQVIAEMSCSPAQYARSLLRVIESRQQLRAVPVFPGMKPVEITSRRMERIMSLKQGSRKRTPILCWVVLLALALLVLPGGSDAVNAMAQEPSLQEDSTWIPVDNANQVNYRVSDNSTAEGKVLKVYKVRDIRKRLCSEMQLSPGNGRQHLKMIAVAAISTPLPHPAPAASVDAQPLPAPTKNFAPSPVPQTPVRPAADQFAIVEIERGDKLIVQATPDAHAALDKELQHLRKFGVRKVCIEARIVSGPKSVLADAIGNWSEIPPMAARPMNIHAVESALRADTFVPADQQHIRQTGQVHTNVTTTLPLKLKVTNVEEMQSILNTVQDSPRMNVMMTPQVVVSNGRTATVQTGTARPFVVAVHESTPVTRIINEGLVLHVEPSLLPNQQLELNCVLAHNEVTIVENISVSSSPAATPITVQVPQVTSRRVETRLKQKLDECLILGGVPLSRDGDSGEELCVILRLRETTNEKNGTASLAPPARNPAESQQPSMKVSAAPRRAAEPYVTPADKQTPPSASVTLQSNQAPRPVTSYKAEYRVIRPSAIARVAHPIAPPTNVAATQPSVVAPVTRALIAVSPTTVQSGNEVQLFNTPKTQPQEWTLRVYNVADLVVPIPGVNSAAISAPSSARTKASDIKRVSGQIAAETDSIDTIAPGAEFTPVVELIYASVDPDSWQNGAVLKEHDESLSLVIRQTNENHDRIVELLNELRQATGQQVSFSCRMFQLTDEQSLSVLRDAVRLHDLASGGSWALVSEDVRPDLLNAFSSAGANDISAPKVTVFDGQTASVGTTLQLEDGHLTRLGMTIQPELLSDSGLLRLHHDVTVAKVSETEEESHSPQAETTTSHSTLMRDGQTLLLVCPDDATLTFSGKLVVIIQPKRISEAELKAD